MFSYYAPESDTNQKSNESNDLDLLLCQFNFSGVTQHSFKLFSSEWKEFKKVFQMFLKVLYKKCQNIDLSDLSEEVVEVISNNKKFLNNCLTLTKASLSKTLLKVLPVASVTTFAILFFFYKDALKIVFPSLFEMNIK
ncbi:hypothetical protein GEMRC1_008343 [Eukaryota sp. GEM-RC1]